jgi:hypothetical protein
MLAKSGKLPTRGGWAFEVKWDGFRAIFSTEGPLRVRSRRGWNMSEHVGFLAELPVQAVLDGELVAFGTDGTPDFERVCERMLHRHSEIPLTFLVFDVLSASKGATSGRSPTTSADGSSMSCDSKGWTGGCRRRSRTGRRYGTRSASTILRAWLRRDCTSLTSAASAPG